MQLDTLSSSFWSLPPSYTWVDAVETIALIVTLGIVAWYTVETYKLRKTAEGQLNTSQASLITSQESLTLEKRRNAIERVMHLRRFDPLIAFKNISEAENSEGHRRLIVGLRKDNNGPLRDAVFFQDALGTKLYQVDRSHPNNRLFYIVIPEPIEDPTSIPVTLRFTNDLGLPRAISYRLNVVDRRIWEVDIHAEEAETPKDTSTG